MTTQADHTPSAAEDLTTGADETMSVIAQFARDNGIALPGETGEPPPDVEVEPVEAQETPGTPVAPSEQDDPPPAAAKPEDGKEQPPKDEREYFQRLAAKDLKLQQERQSRKQVEERLREWDQFDQLMRSGKTLEALHGRYRLGFADLSKQALDLGDKPAPQAQKPADGIDLDKLPPEVREMVEWGRQAKQREAEQQAQSARQEDVGRVAAYLGAGDLAEQFPLVNDLGLHDKVYERYLQHIQTVERPETDQEVAFELRRIAKDIEAQEMQRLTALAERPRAKAALLRALGAQKEAKPARQETRAPNGRSNGAAPAVPNSLATQRASRGRTDEWSTLPIEEQLQRTAELAVSRG